MKLHLLSDLHNEFFRSGYPPDIEHSDADIIVLAGDVDVGLNGLRWAHCQAQRMEKLIVYVAGNHEFYHHDISLLDEMRALAKECNGLYFLENDELVFDGVRFLGCTFWTDYLATGDQAAAMLDVQQRLSDHHVISNGECLFMPMDALQLYLESRSWQEEKLARPFEGKTVVVTHHAPHLLCQHPDFPMSAIGTAFLSDVAELVEETDVWCFGHTHSNLDVTVGKCRIVSNQRGYPTEGVTGYLQNGTISI